MLLGTQQASLFGIQKIVELSTNLETDNQTALDSINAAIKILEDNFQPEIMKLKNQLTSSTQIDRTGIIKALERFEEYLNIILKEKAKSVQATLRGIQTKAKNLSSQLKEQHEVIKEITN